MNRKAVLGEDTLAQGTMFVAAYIRQVKTHF